MVADVYTLTISNIKDTSGNAMPTPKNFQFTVGVLTIANARAIGSGVTIRIQGIVTVANEFASPSYMQDSTGALAVFNSKFSLSAKAGDIWEIAGVLADYNGLLEMNPLSDSLRISTGNPLPIPKLKRATQLDESIEAQLVRVNKVKFTSSGSFAVGVDSAYAADDVYGSISVIIDKDSNIPGSPIPTDSVNIVGVVNERTGTYRLIPRTLADINVIDPPPSQTWLDISVARSKPDGDTVKVRGVVTYAQPSKTAAKTIYIQDFSGGIALYDQKTDTLQIGDSVEVKGILKQFSNLLELSPVDSVLLFARDLSLPAPKVITIPQALEVFESQLVKMFGVSFVESGIFDGGTSGTTYHITDGASQLDVRIPYNSALVGTSIPVGLLDIVGVVGQYNTAYQLIPRTTADLLVYLGPQIISTPVLSSLTDTSFAVDWSTFFDGNSVVYFGSTKNLGDSVVVSTPVTYHSVTVSGLKSGRVYYYQVQSANGSGVAKSFIAPLVTTSTTSSGEMDVYFNYSVDTGYGLKPLANDSIDLMMKLLERISSATQTIDMAVYSFDDFGSSPALVANRIADSLIVAEDRGVKIRIVFDNKITTTPLSKLIAAGIPVVKRAVPGTDNGIMHNKFFIFDGRDTTNAMDDWVITGSWNITNIGTVDDAQDAIFIQDQSLARIYTLEFEEMFGSSTETPNLASAHFGPTKQDNTPHFTYISGKKVEVFYSPSDHTTSNLIRVISSAERNIFFGILAFTRDDIAQTLVTRNNVGVTVRGLIDQQPSVLGNLQGAGVDALQAGHSVVTGFFHHKYAVVDPFNDESDPLVITGSHNWSSAAEDDNDENTLMIHSGDIARQYVQEFTARYKESGGTGIITSISDIASVVPTSFRLDQNYPNPFNPNTVIEYQIPGVGTRHAVSLRVYDLLGREVTILVNEEKPAGSYQVTWDASYLSSGVYFYQIRVDNFVDIKKALLLK